jgi:hypothetical protein
MNLRLHSASHVIPCLPWSCDRISIKLQLPGKFRLIFQFCILNERGEIINWQFTKSEGFDEVKDTFLDIKERTKDNSLKLICIDNCCKWRSLLTDIFPDVSIKQDLFHAVQRFVKTLKKRDPVQRDVASDFSLSPGPG